MNFLQSSPIVLDTSLMESVNKIMNTQFGIGYELQNQCEPRSFIKIKTKEEAQNENVFVKSEVPIYQMPSRFNLNGIVPQLLPLSCYCWCGSGQWHDAQTSEAWSKLESIPNQHYETYKQLKKFAKESNPDISKEEIYEQLLKPFRHEKVKVWDQSQSRFRISYVCKYEECNKEFTKTWNLLDHVRMHEGIKPFSCQFWNKTFTQKGNLKKHNIIQHSTKSLKERKKFKCKICNRKYTERYNLVVSFERLLLSEFKYFVSLKSWNTAF